MHQDKKSFLDRAYDPLFQAVGAFGAALLINASAGLIAAADIMKPGIRFPWMTAASLMLCFAVFNSVSSLVSASMVKYWGRSVYAFMGLATANGLLAWAISGLSISQAGSYRWIYVVVTIGYLIFLGMMAFMRSIVEFAQREEWNHPRLRQKRGKK